MLFLTMHIVHLLAVILWIGGLAFVTGIVLPMAIKTPDALQKVLTFQRVEHRFAPLAKWYNIITGISGFAMVWMMGWQDLYFTRAGLALTFMTAIWLFWFVMLVGLEPIVIRKMLEKMVREGDKMDIDGIFRKVKKLHWFMVAISLAAAAAGAIVAHGGFLY
ncbi:MAG: hypothetical protein A2052_09715 [Deltaproteobacteria bacterium GWA2_54_12]|nr:MAG: hypothetical protein A2052_09715 [Deltaproteobacteria bacterium GWA2_54_12]